MKNFGFVVVAVVMILGLSTLGWYGIERLKNFDLMDVCALRLAEASSGTQTVCVNENTQAGIVKCVNFTTYTRCTMDGWDYDYDR